MKQRIWTLITLVALSLTLTTPALASLLALNYTGYFGPDTTLGGTTLGAETPFSLKATFDSAADISPDPGGYSLFAITSFVLTLGGNSYTASPARDLNVTFAISVDVDTVYLLGFLDSADKNGFGSLFAFTAPPITSNTPTPSEYSGYYFTSFALNSNSYTIALNGGAGDLVVKDFGVGDFKANLTTSAVPEPSTCLLLTLSLGVVGYARRKMGKQV